MKYAWIFLAIFWIIVIANPDFLAYLIWWFFLFLGINILLFSFSIKKSSSSKKDYKDYIKVWDYKIFR